MLIANKYAILVLGALIGLAVNFTFVGAQSYLLEKTEAIYALYTSTLAGIFLSMVIKRINLKNRKFSGFAGLSSLFFVFALVSLNLQLLPEFWTAIVWFFLSIFGMQFYRWVLSELAIHHLDPARANSYFAYLATSYEIGMLIGVSLLLGLPFEFSPFLMLNLGATLFALITIYIFLQYYPKENLEINFSKKSLPPPQIESFRVQTVFRTLMVIAFALGTIRFSAEYVVRLSLKDELFFFTQIKQITTLYLLVCSVLIIIFSFYTGQFIRKNRTSPIKLLYIQASILLVLTIVSMFHPVLLSFVALEVGRRFAENCFVKPSIQMFSSSLLNHYRNKLNSLLNMYFFVVPGVVTTILFSVTHQSALTSESYIILSIILVSVFVIFWSSGIFKNRFTDLLYAFLRSNHKTASILAVQGLSYFRPENFYARMKEVLVSNPKKLLKKTIILGLAYVDEAKSIDTIIDEFKSDKEEIQLAVIDALKASHRFEAVQFLLKVSTARVPTKSRRARTNATLILASIFGKNSIPVLLNGLDSKNERVVANTLEALSLFKAPELIPYFIKHVESDSPRVRANAAMGLYQYKKTKKYYHDVVREALYRDDIPMARSCIYAIGKLRDSNFTYELEGMFEIGKELDEKTELVLAWALAALDSRTGIERFAKILCQDVSAESLKNVMHFYSQLPESIRYDLVKFVGMRQHQDTSKIINIARHLKHSDFDFHHEIDFFDLVLQQFTPDGNGLLHYIQEYEEFDSDTSDLYTSSEGYEAG